MTKIASETKALRTYLALLDNEQRFSWGELTHAAFCRERTRIWRTVDLATAQRVRELRRAS
jgi:hypothetical protein